MEMLGKHDSHVLLGEEGALEIMCRMAVRLWPTAVKFVSKQAEEEARRTGKGWRRAVAKLPTGHKVSDDSFYRKLGWASEETDRIRRPHLSRWLWVANSAAVEKEASDRPLWRPPPWCPPGARRSRARCSRGRHRTWASR
jgi:hypothetical protein